MKLKKTTAVILTASMALGFAGCNSQAKDQSKIEELMEEYVDGLNDFDGDAVLDLTNWDDDDKDYIAVQTLLDEDFFKAEYGEEGGEDFPYFFKLVVVFEQQSDIQYAQPEEECAAEHDGQEVFERLRT